MPYTRQPVISIYTVSISRPKHQVLKAFTLLFYLVYKEFKFHLVSWSKVCSLISEGGLGIRNLLVFNRALLGKWMWCYGIERDALWRIVVDSKYDSLWGGWCSIELAGTFGWGCGRTLEKARSHFQAFLDSRWEMGLELDFGMIYGVGIRFSRMLFLFFLVLLGQRTLLLQLMWSSYAVLFSGT